MTNTLFYRYYVRYSIGMGLYGITRGYRSEPKQQGVSPPLLADRVVLSIANGFVYSLPGWNVVHMLKLVNRMEIRMRGWNPADYPLSYEECMMAHCSDTI